VESHHILEFHQFPQYAKDKGNIVVLCQRCHPRSHAHRLDVLGEAAVALARLKPEVRARIAGYIERREPDLRGYADRIRYGEEAAADYFFRRLQAIDRRGHHG
jgi:hypothetical protein